MKTPEQIKRKLKAAIKAKLTLAQLYQDDGAPLTAQSYRVAASELQAILDWMKA